MRAITNILYAEQSGRIYRSLRERNAGLSHSMPIFPRSTVNPNTPSSGFALFDVTRTSANATSNPARPDRITEIFVYPHRTVLGDQEYDERLFFSTFEIDVSDDTCRGNCSANPFCDPGTLCDRERTAVIAGKLDSRRRTLSRIVYGLLGVLDVKNHGLAKL